MLCKSLANYSETTGYNVILCSIIFVRIILLLTWKQKSMETLVYCIEDEKVSKMIHAGYDITSLTKHFITNYMLWPINSHVFGELY